jgi:hypothetical protein
MFELIGALIGGVFRLAPEVLKILDRKAWKWVASLSALVRPAVTYWFVAFYSVVKAAGLYLAFLQDGSWTAVLLSGWTDYDEGMLSLILTFWFVGRVWESKK